MDEIVELKVGELFAGAGGLSLGFILADHPNVRFCPVFAVDNDISSLDSYKYNMKWLSQNEPAVLPKMPGVFNRDVDCLNVSAVLRLLKLKKGELDLLLGGPPCQGFSSSNRRSKAQSKEDRNRLINVFLDRLSEFQPKMFLIENVQGVQWAPPTQDMQLSPIQESLFPDIVSGNESTNVQNFLLKRADTLGYYVWSGVLDAVEFGVPQHRMRFFLFGVRKEFISDKSVVSLVSFLEKLKVTERVTVEKAIGDLPVLENGQKWIDGEYHPQDNTYIRKMRRFMSNGDLYDHFTTRHADYVIERYRKIPEGGNWKNIMNEMTNYKKVDNTHSNIYRRLVGNAPAITISHYRKSMIIHPSQHRGLSFREACRLQSFPDWYRFKGSLDNKQQQLANAVPPLMAAAVANAIGSFWLMIMSSKSGVTEPLPVMIGADPVSVSVLK
jgi:DNA-methyltransferase (dcm)